MKMNQKQEWFTNELTQIQEPTHKPQTIRKLKINRKVPDKKEPKL